MLTFKLKLMSAPASASASSLTSCPWPTFEENFSYAGLELLGALSRSHLLSMVKVAGIEIFYSCVS